MKFFLALQLLLLSNILVGAQDKQAVAYAEKEDFKNQMTNQVIIDSYVKDPQKWPDDSLLPVAICYALKGNFTTAETLYQKFLVKKPDSTRALRGLGNCLILEQRYDEGIAQFRKAWALKDVQALGQLALVFIMQKNWAEVDKLVPDLLANRKKEMQVVNSLIALSVLKEPKNKTLFDQSIEGISDETLLASPDTKSALLQALKIFGDENRLKELQDKIDQGAKVPPNHNPNHQME